MAKQTEGFSKAEREAMAQRAAELHDAKGVKGAAKKARELDACLEAIAALDGLDRRIAERYHVVVTSEAPELEPKTWYGFPSYANDGDVVTFVQPASKFESRYATIGFNDTATLDDGPMWATAFAVVDWNDDVEERLRTAVRAATATKGDDR